MFSFGAALAAAPILFADDFFSYTGEPVVEPPAHVLVTTHAFSAPGDRFRVASYNIENFTDGVGDEPSRTPEVAERHARMAAVYINEMDPDLLVVQEIENGVMLEKLNNALARPFAVGYLAQFGSGGADPAKINEGVLSRFPVENPTELDFGPLQGPGRPTRGLFRFEVDLGEARRLLVYVMHLKSNYGNRERNIAQRRHALTILRADADRIVSEHPDVTWEIMAIGDTNVDPDLPQFAADPSFEPLADWVDLWRKVPAADRVTIPTRYGDPTKEFEPAAFDRFFVNPEMTNGPWTVSLPVAIPKGCSSDVNVMPGQGDHVSDHYPVYLDVTR